MCMQSAWRSRFPFFKINEALVYLDNAATTQRLDHVIDVMHTFDIGQNANVHRGVYELSNQATDGYEAVRGKVASFINASSAKNIGFTRGTTESINIIAQGFLAPQLSKGDNVIVSIMEHHANFLPWQEVCKRNGAALRILGLDDDGKISAASLTKMIDKHTKFVALTHISNTLGRINPIEELIKVCNDSAIPVLIDAAQSAALHPLDVQRLGCDFMAFSGHKLFGSMGTGVLYAHEKHHDHISPFIVGGGMIQHVSVEGSTYRSFPYSLDAGTPNVSGILGLGSAIDFLLDLDRKAALKHITSLIGKLVMQLQQLKEVQVLPYYDAPSGILSFTIDGIHAHDIAGYLSRDQIAVRAGMHCTQPLLDSMAIGATTRVSFSIYNQESDVDRLIVSLRNLIDFWK